MAVVKVKGIRILVSLLEELGLVDASPSVLQFTMCRHRCSSRSLLDQGLFSCKRDVIVWELCGCLPAERL